jgi:hypothetical protein
MKAFAKVVKLLPCSVAASLSLTIEPYAGSDGVSRNFNLINPAKKIQVRTGAAGISVQDSDL